ncbi:MAG: hypothetical protein ACO2PN_13520 [Pyrobaculum sp.]|jgi:hypothetical protein
MFGGRLGATLYIHFIRRWVNRDTILRSAERRALGFAGAASAVDAAEVVKGAVREAVYATRESGGKSSSAARD